MEKLITVDVIINPIDDETCSCTSCKYNSVHFCVLFREDLYTDEKLHRADYRCTQCKQYN